VWMKTTTLTPTTTATTIKTRTKTNDGLPQSSWPKTRPV
jgi:hypothetical protein